MRPFLRAAGIDTIRQCVTRAINARDWYLAGQLQRVRIPFDLDWMACRDIKTEAYVEHAFAACLSLIWRRTFVTEKSFYPRNFAAKPLSLK
ncbi:hypothetical protein JOD97_002609 [Duganella sp. 1411]|uniref:hypothetical protein n=1 Tax=Duganella sp. 1411 TaxID=2806572 RepID=UPI001AE80559|nr:hypothetical protein [Duganella sp. 1411]MBP1204567.1 hypothetical protein [Duganella sp. 1411]